MTFAEVQLGHPGGQGELEMASGDGDGLKRLGRAKPGMREESHA